MLDWTRLAPLGQRAAHQPLVPQPFSTDGLEPSDVTRGTRSVDDPHDHTSQCGQMPRLTLCLAEESRRGGDFISPFKTTIKN